MAKGMRIVYPVTIMADMAGVQKTATDLTTGLTNKMSAFKIDFGKIIPGESIVEKLGGFGEFFNTVRAGATDVGKLTANFTLMEKTVNGVTVQQRIATKEINELRGAAGQLSVTTKDLSKEARIAQEGFEKQGFAVVGVTSETMNLVHAEKLADNAIKEAEKTTNAATTAAEKYLAKSKNMGGQQVQSARQAAQAILDQAKAIEKLDRTSQDYADGFAKLTQLQKNFNIALEGTKVGANAFQGWATRIGNAIQQTIAYSFSIGLVYKAQQLLNDAVRYAIDLNTEMVKIQVLQAEGAQTPEEIDALAQSFNQLGQEMGASTLEIARGSVEWFRQGRTVAETQELMRASMMLSKLGAMESADATNYLTSITNAFKIEVSDTVSVVNKLIAVDNIAATSAGELATAMRYTSMSAAIAGVEMEQLISYIGTVSTVTRQNAEMIGQAFKTMFARMTQIQGGGTDEEGWTISKVEKALAAVNIEIKNADGTWRNMGTVLEETAAKWDTLTTREQTEIATAVAGVRQKEAFLVLMENMDKALMYQAAQTDATGLAMDRYGIYLESVQAKQGKLTASMQELYASVVNSKMVGAFYDIAIGIVQTITQGKLLIPILATILVLLIAINKEKIKGAFTDASGGISIFIKFLNKLKFELVGFLKDLTMGGISLTNFKMILGSASSQIIHWAEGLGVAAGTASGFIAVLAGITAGLAILAGVWYFGNKDLERRKKLYEENTKAANDYIEALKGLPEKEAAPREIFQSIKTLEVKRETTGGLSTEEAEELTRLYNELYDLLPNLNYSFDEMGNAILNSSVTMADLQKATEALYLSAIDGEQNLIFWIGEREKAYITANVAAGKSTEEQEILNGLMGSSVEEIQTWVNEVKSGKRWVEGAGKAGGRYVEIASQAEKDIAKALQEAIDNGADDVDMVGILADLSQDATSKLANSKSTIDGMSNEYEQLWRTVLSNSGQAYEDALVLLEQKALTNPALAAAREEAWASMWEMAVPSDVIYQTEAWQTSLDGVVKSYFTAMDAIDSVVDSISNISEATDEIGKANAIDEFRKQVEELDKTLDIPPELLEQIQMAIASMDPTKIENVSIEFIKWLGTNEELTNSFPKMAASLGQASLDAIASIQGINTTITVFGESFVFNAEQAAQATNWMAQSVWNLAGNSTKGLQLVADNGDTIIAYSVADIIALVEAGIITENNFAKQSSEILAKYAVNAASIVTQAFGNILKGLPTPPPISLPTGGGGGGGGEDPRIKAINEEIKGYQDEIYHLEEIIEDLEDRIKPIEDAIDAEQRLIELHQREIAVIEEQIEDIDRQIELKNREIDAIDDLIQKEERKKDILDRQIDSYQRQIDLIDRQIEMHERDKEVLEAAIEAQEKIKEPFEAQKDELDKLLDSFNEYIDAQKEALQVQKDELDYAKKLLDLNKKLSATQAELALASLDTSEEGMKRRLELEMQLAEDQKELAETTEERKFELQTKALEDAQKAYEESINAQKKALDDQIAAIDKIINSYEKQIEDIDYLIKQHELEVRALEDLIYPLEQQKIAIDLIIQGYEDTKIPIQDQIKLLEDSKIPLEDQIYLIEEQIEDHETIIQVLEDEKYALEQLIKPIQEQIDKYNELIETLNHEKSHIEDTANAMGGGSGGGPGFGATVDDTKGKVDDLFAKMMLGLADTITNLGLASAEVYGLAQAWIAQGLEVDAAYAKAEAYLRLLENIKKQHPEQFEESGPTPISPPAVEPGIGHPWVAPIAIHSGGIATEHGGKGYSGILKDSEIFAKLLKGEYVATEDQMRNFLRKTIPSIATEATKMLSEERDALKYRGRKSTEMESKKSTFQPSPSMSVQPIIIKSTTTPSSGELIKPIIPIRPSDNTYKDMNFEMNINVQGSLDEKVLPKLKKDVIKEINKSLEKRGIRRTADAFSI